MTGFTLAAWHFRAKAAGSVHSVIHSFSKQRLSLTTSGGPGPRGRKVNKAQPGLRDPQTSDLVYRMERVLRY